VSDRHPASTIYLVLGLLFATLGVIGIVNAFVPVPPTVVGIVFASAFTVAGLIALVGAFRRSAD